MDHERVNVSSSAMSCGVMELSRINEDSEGVLYALGSRLYHPSRGNPCACFIFSDIVGDGETSSIKLMREVHKQKVGRVIATTAMENPRTGNLISIYIWEINHENFKKWYSEQRVAKLSKVGS